MNSAANELEVGLKPTLPCFAASFNLWHIASVPLSGRVCSPLMQVSRFLEVSIATLAERVLCFGKLL